MDRKKKWGMTFSLLVIVFFATMSCYIRPLINPPDNEVDTVATLQSLPTENTDNQISTDIAEQWTIYQCSAIQDVTTELSKFIEDDDGNGNISCAYTHTFTNKGNQPIRLIYYDRYFPSDLYNQPSEWKSHTVIQPGELTGIRSNIFQNTTEDDLPPRYECFVFSLAFVYEIPECRWIIEGESFHIDILHIAEEEPILSPCTLISPVSYSDAVPDISEGLRH